MFGFTLFEELTLVVLIFGQLMVLGILLFGLAEIRKQSDRNFAHLMLMVKKKLNTPEPTAPEMQDYSPGPSTINQSPTMNQQQIMIQQQTMDLQPAMNQSPTYPAYFIQPGSLNVQTNPYQICYSNINEMKQLNV
ncbi:unnamed protein product [Chironomus riparius]|uniref:Uncharacterized protein n=1 Tax=Chironomus riparius TaxID=315576 RepID=A0A9N9S216_9DIPT|nr:unnamed protein product [Chironomus riparius]